VVVVVVVVVGGGEGGDGSDCGSDGSSSCYPLRPNQTREGKLSRHSTERGDAAQRSVCTDSQTSRAFQNFLIELL
jgi:hypothetical protein